MFTNRALRTTVLAAVFGRAGLLGAGVASAHVTASTDGTRSGSASRSSP